jgi:hypothetical protein
MKNLNPIRVALYASLITILATSMTSCGSSCGASKWRKSNKYYGTINQPSSEAHASLWSQNLST